VVPVIIIKSQKIIAFQKKDLCVMQQLRSFRKAFIKVMPVPLEREREREREKERERGDYKTPSTA
jgi:hypothetical protein